MVLPNKIGMKLSARRKLPVILAYDAEFWPHQFLSMLWRTKSWKRIEENDEYGIYQIGGWNLKFLRIPNKSIRAPSYLGEFFAQFPKWPWQYAPPTWTLKLLRIEDKSTKSPDYIASFFSTLSFLRRQYKPPWSLEGKVVLDAGSGCGETAYHFFRWGAKKVIAVDQNPLACQVLRENADANGWDVEIHCEPFNEKHMFLDYDFAKLDVEGGERCLLNLKEMPRKHVVAEVHSADLVLYFENVLGFHFHEILRIDSGRPAYAIMRYNPETMQ